jgi:hypothetical protein
MPCNDEVERMDRDYMDALLGDDYHEPGDRGDSGRTGTDATDAVSLDGETIRIRNLTVTDRLAAQYLEALQPAARPAALQRMIAVGSYALVVGTRQVGEIDLKSTVAAALEEPLDELTKSITDDASERERRVLAEIIKRREKIINVPSLAGGEFEDIVEQLLQRVALDHVIERTSRTAGIDGDAGDICVDSPDGIRVVFECKRGYEGGLSQAKILSELEKVKSNRQAAAGVIVLDTPKALGGRRLWRLSPLDYAAVVTREEDEDGLALYCALLLARSSAAVRRTKGAEAAELSQHAEALEVAVRQHDELLTLLNHINDDVRKGHLLVEDSRRAVRDAASRLATFSSPSSS